MLVARAAACGSPPREQAAPGLAVPGLCRRVHQLFPPAVPAPAAGPASIPFPNCPAVIARAPAVVACGWNAGFAAIGCGLVGSGNGRPACPACDRRTAWIRRSGARAPRQPRRRGEHRQADRRVARRGDPIVFVEHDWQGGPLERGTPGFELKEVVTGEPTCGSSRRCTRRSTGMSISTHGCASAGRGDRGVRNPDELLLRDDRPHRLRPRIRRVVRPRRNPQFDLAAADGEVVPAARSRVTGVNLQDEFARL